MRSDQRDMPIRADAVHWRRSLRLRIAAWSGAVNVILLLLVIAAIAWLARRQIVDTARRETRASTLEAADRLDTAMRAITVTTRGLSDLLANTELDPAQRTAALRAMVSATPGCMGGLLILEPARPGEPAYARYVAANGSDRDFVADGYDFRAQGWYQRTLAAPDGWWSEPYRNRTAGDVWTVTYNVPLRPRGRGVHTRGMISLDLPLGRLTDPLESLIHLPGWRVTLAAPTGKLATNPDVGVEQDLTLDQHIRRSGRSDLLPAAEALRLHRPLQLLHTDAITGERRYTVVEPVGETGWMLLVAQSYERVMQRLNRTLGLLLAAGAVLALLCTLGVRKLARHISLPVERLAASAAQLAEGHYQSAVPFTGRRDEVGLLARTLEQARTSIQQQLVEIEEMAAARQKLDSELSIARDIQLAMLPPGRVFTAAGRQLEAHALLEPAKAVGGDFYTFIEDAGALWFVIGDVSDKGVPAALFMARAVTVLEVAARASRHPGQVLAEASQQLVEGNDTCMFATVLCGRIELRSGHCTLASAGHEAPLLLHADGRVQTLPIESGPPLGFEVSEAFAPWQCELTPGATLLAYTDGITEAFDPQQQAFGEERLAAALQPGLDAQAQCQRLIAQVHAFAQPAPQSDDLTVLALRLRPDSQTT